MNELTNEVVNTEEVVNTTEEETKTTYTQDEVNDLLQREVDRRVTSALKKQETKFKEARRVEQMNEQEKYVYQLEQREKEVAEKEAQLALAEMKNTTSKILADKGISLSLVDLVVNTDADVTNANIKLLEKAFKESVKAEVQKRLGTDVPKKNLPLDETLTKKQFDKMTLAEMQQLSKEQPELYRQLTN